MDEGLIPAYHCTFGLEKGLFLITVGKGLISMYHCITNLEFNSLLNVFSDFQMVLDQLIVSSCECSTVMKCQT